MKRILLFVINLCCAFSTLKAESYILHNKLKHFTAEEIKDTWEKIDIPQLYLPVNNGVTVYEILFTTDWIDGSPIKSSGLVMVPDNLYDGYSTIIYHNGTSILRRRVEELGYNQFSICAGLAADGYLVVIPDYIGRGKGDKFQLYLHAKTTSQNSVNLLLAANHMINSLGHPSIGDLYITGYSQGGHAALSTQRLVEEKYSKVFNLVATSPMSGPYDLAGTIRMDRVKDSEDPLLLMYVIKSYQDGYQMYPHMSMIFKSPFDSLVNVYFDGEHDYHGLYKYFTGSFKDIFQPTFIQDEFFTEGSKFKNILIENSIYDFIPKVPTQFCYCTDDDVVSTQNTINAYTWMKKRGARKIKLRNEGKNLDHEECAIYTVIDMKLFFDRYRDVKHSNFKNDFSNAALSLAKTTRKIFPKLELF